MYHGGMSMAQAVGEEPIHDSGMTPDDIQEWFGGDMDDARESFAYERQESIAALQRENDHLRARLAEYEG